MNSGKINENGYRLVIERYMGQEYISINNGCSEPKYSVFNCYEGSWGIPSNRTEELRDKNNPFIPFGYDELSGSPHKSDWRWEEFNIWNDKDNELDARLRDVESKFSLGEPTLVALLCLDIPLSGNMREAIYEIAYEKEGQSDEGYKTTVVVAVLESEGKQYVVHQSFGHNYDSVSPLWIWKEGNMSSDINRAMLIRQQIDEKFPKCFRETCEDAHYKYVWIDNERLNENYKSLMQELKVRNEAQNYNDIKLKSIIALEVPTSKEQAPIFIKVPETEDDVFECSLIKEDKK